MKPIAVIGAHGQLGSGLMRHWGPSVRSRSRTPTSRSPIRNRSNRMFWGRCSRSTSSIAAAYNAVDRAEEEPAAAFAVNAFGPLHLARHCESNGRHHSPARQHRLRLRRLPRRHATPRTEQERPEPTSVYGTSKLAGESLAVADLQAALRRPDLRAVRQRGRRVERELRADDAPPRRRTGRTARGERPTLHADIDR